MSVALELFCLDVAVKILLNAELSVFIGVGAWVKPSSWNVMRRGTDVCSFF